MRADRQAGRRPAAAAIQRTFRILPQLRPHIVDLALGLRAVADPRVLGGLTLRLRRLIDLGTDAPKVKVRLDSETDSRLEELVQDLKGELTPEISVYEVVNAALLASRYDRLSSTYRKRLPLPDEAEAETAECRRIA